MLAALAASCISSMLASGFAIKKGHISLLHSYHYKNVIDREGYCKAIGKGIAKMR